MRLGLCCVEEHFQALWNILEETALGIELPYLLLAQKWFMMRGKFGKIPFVSFFKICHLTGRKAHAFMLIFVL